MRAALPPACRKPRSGDAQRDRAKPSAVPGVPTQCTKDEAPERAPRHLRQDKDPGLAKNSAAGPDQRLRSNQPTIPRGRNRMNSTSRMP